MVLLDAQRPDGVGPARGFEQLLPAVGLRHAHFPIIGALLRRKDRSAKAWIGTHNSVTAAKRQSRTPSPSSVSAMVNIAEMNVVRIPPIASFAASTSRDTREMRSPLPARSTRSWGISMAASKTSSRNCDRPVWPSLASSTCEIPVRIPVASAAMNSSPREFSSACEPRLDATTSTMRPSNAGTANPVTATHNSVSVVAAASQRLAPKIRTTCRQVERPSAIGSLSAYDDISRVASLTESLLRCVGLPRR